MRFSVAIAAILGATSAVHAFIPVAPQFHRVAKSVQSNHDDRSARTDSVIPMSSSRFSSNFGAGGSSGGGNGRRAKKTVADRTPEEAVSLIRDIIKAVVEAGPRAGPARSLQAYLALTRTVQEFLPRPGQRTPPEFSAPKALRVLFERLGATYVKLGQFIASSPTLFPKEYVVEFQKCLDSTDPVDWSIIKRVIESEIGPISNTFSHIDSTPLASASIAQVHAATLQSTGEEVVIKVQKPGTDQTLTADLGFIFVTSRVLEFLQPDWERTSLSAIAGDIRASMLEELDFEKEARNTQEFRKFLADNKLLNVAMAPKVIRATRKVFIMERLNGISMLDEETLVKAKKDPEVGQRAIITALNIWTQSVSQMPWFHADVHAGNLLLCDDGRVGFIDFGIVGRVSDRTFQAVNELSIALTLADYPGMARALCNMGATDAEVDVEKFGKDIETLMTRMNSVQPDIAVAVMADGTVAGSINFDENEVTNLLLEMVEVTEDNGLKLPREFGLLVKQSLYFDRYLKILAPELDVMNDDRVSGIGGDGAASEASAALPAVNGTGSSPTANGDDKEDVVIDV